MKNVLKYAGIAFIAVSFFSCGDDDTPTVPPVVTQPNIVQVASGAPDFSSLVAALTRDSFGDTYTSLLSGDGPFTVFAPTNEAFSDLLSDLGVESLEDISNETLAAVLAAHVIQGAAVTSDILPDSAETLGGTITIDPATVTITDENGRMINVTMPDIPAINGVIHGVDKVILPSPLPATLVGGPFNFVAGDGVDDFIEDGAITVVAGLGENSAWVVTDAAGEEILGVPPSFTGPNFESAGGGTCLVWYLTYNGELTGAEMGNNVADLQGDFSLSNPITVNRKAADIVDIAVANPDFSILVSALTRESFGDTYTSLLSGEGPFTVFAPTNDAFADLLEELGLTSLDMVDDATLEAVLAYHVISGAKVTSDMLPTSATTLGGDITIDPATATITDDRGRMSQVVIADVDAANGVIHAIDKVILPPAAM